MRYIRPVLLALAFAVLAVPLVAPGTAAPAAAGSGGSSGVTDVVVIREVPNSTNYLDISQGETVRGDRGEGSLDVAGAVAMDVQRLRGEYSRRAFDAAYAGTSNESTREAWLRAEVDRLDERITTLKEYQRDSIQAYNAGTLSTSRFLRRLVTVHVAARQVDAQFTHLRQSAGVSLPNDLDDRMRTLEAEVVPLRGAVRGRAGEAIAGQRAPVSVYALTSENALVLSTAGDDRFYRDAYVPDDREPVGPDRFVTEDDSSGITGAIDRVKALYPWAYADTVPSLEKFSGTSVYRVRLDHSQGRLTTYLDGTTETSFRELQRLQVEDLPTEPVTNRTDELVVTVDRTYGTGPMEVTTTDPATGEPVDSTVLVNGNTVGVTGADGSLWTVTPHRFVRIVVVTDDARVRLSFFAG